MHTLLYSVLTLEVVRQSVAASFHAIVVDAETAAEAVLSVLGVDDLHRECVGVHHVRTAAQMRRPVVVLLAAAAPYVTPALAANARLCVYTT